MAEIIRQILLGILRVASWFNSVLANSIATAPDWFINSAALIALGFAIAIWFPFLSFKSKKRKRH